MKKRSESSELQRQLRERAAYEQVKSEMRAIPKSQLLAVNIDIALAVERALKTLPNVRRFRPRMAGLPEFDLKRLDNLELYSLALSHIQGVLADADRTVDVSELVERAQEIRASLVSGIQALASFGIIDGKLLEELRGGRSYRILATELALLVGVFRKNWKKIEGKTPVQPTNLAEAEVLVEQILSGLEQRTEIPAEVAAIGLERQQIFTLFVSSYNEARRAIGYLRFNDGDSDQIVPSLYAYRTPKPKLKTALAEPKRNHRGQPSK